MHRHLRISIRDTSAWIANMADANHCSMIKIIPRLSQFCKLSRPTSFQKPYAINRIPAWFCKIFKHTQVNLLLHPDLVKGSIKHHENACYQRNNLNRKVSLPTLMCNTLSKTLQNSSAKQCIWSQGHFVCDRSHWEIMHPTNPAR